MELPVAVCCAKDCRLGNYPTPPAGAASVSTGGSGVLAGPPQTRSISRPALGQFSPGFRTFLHPLLLVLAVSLLAMTTARAASGDEHWDAAFGYPGATNYVYSIAEHKGVLYCAGQSPNGVTNTLLWSWDGGQWSPVATFSSPWQLTVYDLAFMGDTLYAVGNFTNVNGQTIQGLAQWDGSNWSTVGGFSGYAYALLVAGNQLYVGGRFTNTIGSVTITNIGYWDGAWHALGNGLGKSGDTVGALALTNGLLYAGGLFTNSGPMALTNLAVWNGSTWAGVGGGINGQVMSLVFKGADLYAAGMFSKAGSTTANYVAKWDGANWSPLGSGLSGGLGALSLAVLGDRLCVGGYFTSAGGAACTNFAVWDGTSWLAPLTNISGGGSCAFSRLATLDGILYVGGLFTILNGVFVNQFAAWDGTHWMPVGNPDRINGLYALNVRALGTDDSNVYAGGSFTYAGQVLANRVARWDGSRWHALGSGVNGTVTCLALSGNNLYVGGSFTTAGGIAATHLARWDGASWYAVGGGISGTVSSLAIFGTDLLVGGNFQFSASDRTASAIARWDGAKWWSFGGFLFSVYISGVGVDAIAVNGSDVYLGGNFLASNSSSGTTSTNVVRFDGVDWQPMGGGVNTNVYALAVLGSDVYAGGTFTNASGVPVSRIARWDGASWHSVDNGVSGSGNFSVSALAALGSRLYAAGSFTNASGLAVGRIAQWDGVSWSALGRGVTYPGVSSSSVAALAASGSDLFVGGTFGAAGGKTSGYVARWNETRDFDQPPILRLSKLRRAGGSFKFSVTATNVSSYVIEATTNLSIWTSLDTNTAAYYEFMDFNAGGFGRRFYRARTGP